jgi:hypothetical protein
MQREASTYPVSELGDGAEGGRPAWPLIRALSGLRIRDHLGLIHVYP